MPFSLADRFARTHATRFAVSDRLGPACLVHTFGSEPTDLAYVGGPL